MTTITLADVAAYAHVSTATVSMVLRNRGRISEPTRQKVLAALDSLGYVYNQTAANLRNRSSNQLGLLLPDITNPFFAEMTAGLSDEMEQHQQMLFLANSGESAGRQEKFVDALLQHNASGMVLCAARQTPTGFYESLKRRNVPVIMVVRPPAGVSFDYVGTDNFLGTQLATQHLLDIGHRNIAFIGGVMESMTRAQRIGGYTSKLVENNLLIRSEWIISCDASQSAGATAAQDLLRVYPQVTAAVCHQDIVALGVMQSLRNLDRRVGADFGLVGFDDISEASLVQPTLTTVSVSSREIGRKAGELLWQRIQGNDEPVKSVILPPSLVVRQSCGFGNID